MIWTKKAVKELLKENVEKDFYIAQLEDALETTRKLLAEEVEDRRVTQEFINEKVEFDKEINLKL